MGMWVFVCAHACVCACVCRVWERASHKTPFVVFANRTDAMGTSDLFHHWLVEFPCFLLLIYTLNPSEFLSAPSTWRRHFSLLQAIWARWPTWQRAKIFQEKDLLSTSHLVRVCVCVLNTGGSKSTLTAVGTGKSLWLFIYYHIIFPYEQP